MKNVSVQSKSPFWFVKVLLGCPDLQGSPHEICRGFLGVSSDPTSPCTGTRGYLQFQKGKPLLSRFMSDQSLLYL